MSKMPIEWHKECLVNQESSYARIKEDLEWAMNREFKARVELEEYRSQIKRAELMGKDGFDREKFKPG